MSKYVTHYGIMAHEKTHEVASFLFNSWKANPENWFYAVSAEVATSHEIPIIARIFLVRTNCEYCLRCSFVDNKCIFTARKVENDGLFYF